IRNEVRPEALKSLVWRSQLRSRIAIRFEARYRYWSAIATECFLANYETPTEPVAGPPAVLNVSLISAWIGEEGWINKTLAEKLQVSERAISSLRNNGSYHGMEAITKLANLMGRDPDDLYMP